MVKTCALWIACFIFSLDPVLAQSAIPTTHILTRMTMLETQYGRGSTFSVDVDGREYWITAKHMFTGDQHGSIATKSASVRILDPGAEGEKWITVNFAVIDTEKDVDIVVLAPPVPLLKDPTPSVPMDSTSLTLGDDCEFLGFPYGTGWQTKVNGQSFWLPFIKHCTVSGGNSMPGMKTDGQKVWILDGINNGGFSGGPVISGTNASQKIFAVISGYETEPSDVISSAVKPKTPNRQSSMSAADHKEIVKLNSGFIIAYDISYAAAAINKDPIGPLRVAK